MSSVVENGIGWWVVGYDGEIEGEWEEVCVGSSDWGCCGGMRRRRRWARVRCGCWDCGCTEGGWWSGEKRNAAKLRQTIWTVWNALN